MHEMKGAALPAATGTDSGGRVFYYFAPTPKVSTARSCTWWWGFGGMLVVSEVA